MNKFFKIIFRIIIFSIFIVSFILIEQKVFEKEYKLITFSERYNIDKQKFVTLGQNNKSRPIVLFGCSFIFGETLKFEDTPSFLLSKETKRPVYLRAHPGYSIQQMLYQLRKKEIYEEIPNPEYCIYTFMYDHPKRLYMNTSWWQGGFLNINYKKTKDNNLIEQKPIFYELNRLHFSNKIHFYITEQKAKFFKKDTFDFIKLHFLLSKKEAEQHWKNTKFVILIYPQNNNYYTETNRWKELEDYGFIITNLKKYNNNEYFNKPEDFSIDKHHPSASVWKKIIPELCKALNL